MHYLAGHLLKAGPSMILTTSAGGADVADQIGQQLCHFTQHGQLCFGTPLALCPFWIKELDSCKMAVLFQATSVGELDCLRHAHMYGEVIPSANKKVAHAQGNVHQMGG